MNIIITGANRGLGLELTKKFVSEGHNVAACYYPNSSFSELDTLSQAKKIKNNPIRCYKGSADFECKGKNNRNTVSCGCNGECCWNIV